MDAPAVGRQHAQAPVADLVAEALDDDRAVARQDARRGLLLEQEVEQVLRRERVEVVVGLQRRGVLLDGPAAERADRLAELLRAADAVALPERHRARRARRRRDDHAVAADLLDPPGARAEQERLAGARLVDHLLIELADAAAVGQRDAEQPAIGDRAGVRDRQLARALARADRAADAVPDDPRAQLGELLRRVAPVEHVEHVLQQRARQLGVGVRARDERVEVVDREGARIRVRRARRDRDDLLREHVERVAWDDGRLDLAVAHELADDRALEQVGAELREDPPLRDVADVVPGAPDSLQAAGDGLRRLDLQDEVDGAHVDAELERGGRDEAGQLAGLQQLLDDEALLARERAVMGARDVARSDALGEVGVGELVEAQRQALGAAAGVDEDDRRAVLLDELEDLGVDRRPDRASRRLVARPGQRVERIDGV